MMQTSGFAVRFGQLSEAHKTAFDALNKQFKQQTSTQQKLQAYQNNVAKKLQAISNGMEGFQCDYSVKYAKVALQCAELYNDLVTQDEAMQKNESADVQTRWNNWLPQQKNEVLKLANYLNASTHHPDAFEEILHALGRAKFLVAPEISEPFLKSFAKYHPEKANEVFKQNGLDLKA